MEKIVLREYGILPNTDITVSLYKLFCEHKTNTEFVFEEGDYFLSPQNEMMFDYRISNSDYIEKRALGLWLKNMKNCTLSGNGARLWFSGHMQPISLDNCADIIIKDLYINWENPLVAEGIVRDFGEDYIDLYIHPENFPHRYRDEWLEFYIGNDEWFPLCQQGQIQYDCNNLSVRRDSGDKYTPKKIENLGEGIYRFHFGFSVDTAAGNIFILRHNKRRHAGIFSECCERLSFENITVHSCGGLGCLAQFCKDLTYSRVNFLPDRTRGRLVSNGRDDGMHITCCSGTVTIEECSFLGLMDDPINVHGCCVKAVEQVDDRTLRCKYGHIQARGFYHWAKTGDEIAFIERGSMETVKTARAEKYRLEDLDTFTITFSEPLSDDMLQLVKTDALALDNLSNTAEFICRKNRFGSCRARGVLVSTPKRVLIEDNVFESSGAAILVAGDSNGWFESGECHDVTIKGNVFTQNCLSSMYQFCEGVISVCPVVPKPRIDKPYHKNIKIINNVFDSASVPALYAFSCKDLVFSGNKIFGSPSAHKWHPCENIMKLEYCLDATISDNIFVGETELSLNPKIENCENVGFSCLIM